jgi:Lrp/AsnC family leucine-responsive transcriptional regulator
MLCFLPIFGRNLHRRGEAPRGRAEYRMGDGRHRLDQIDRRILNELQKNCRVSNLELARAVHLSESPCLRRHKLLESRGVIVGYTAIVMPTLLGFGVVAFIDVVLDRAASDADMFRQVAMASPEVTGCTATAGDYDYLLKVVAKDVNSVSLFVNNRLRRIPGVKNTNVNLVIDPDPALFAFYNYFHPEHFNACFDNVADASGLVDDIDLRIIKALIENGRLRSAHLARQLGQSHSSCLRRIRALERSGAIRGYTTVIEPSALDRSLVTFLGLKLKHAANTQQIKALLAARLEVAAVHELAGNVDLLLRVTSSDVDEYARFVRECLRQIEGVDTFYYSYAIDPLPTLFLSYRYSNPQARPPQAAENSAS